MSISFSCACGKDLKARDDLAGKKTRCPDCGAILRIPGAAASPAAPPISAPAPAPAPFDDEDDSPYQLDPAAAPPPSLAPSPSMAFAPARPAEAGSENAFKPAMGPKKKAPAAPRSSVPASGGDGSSLLEYSYLLLVLALIPLVVSLLGREDKDNIPERIARTIAKAPPEEQKKIESVFNRGEVSIDEAFAVLPGGKLDGAHLSRDTMVHYVYAGIAAVAFLLFLAAIFTVERANPLHLLGIGAFTGTVGIVFLLLVQFCASIRFGGIRGRGVVIIIMLILAFIGWSYNSANDPDSNFLLSALGFTFGVGLCEEVTKAIPLFVAFRRHSHMGWRPACLWGLASGIGFGVSEGVMYSSRYYNGFGGVDIYLVRFVSCVALHAMWSASVGIAIARNVDAYEEVEDAAGFGLFMIRVVAVPMVLHGFYDTLLKQDMNVWALLVALLSFAWFAWHIEMARGSNPEPGRPGAARARKGVAY